MNEKIKKYNTGYTQVLNDVLYDNRLSLRAKGIYAYLFSKPDGWQFHTNTMSKDLKESKGQIYAAIKELIVCGYIIRKQINENGVFGGTIYEFLEPCNKIPYAEIPCAEKTAYGSTPTHNNTNNISNTDIYNNTDIDNMFTSFWEEYIPVRCEGRFVDKGSKKIAKDKFTRIIKSGVKYDEIIEGLRAYLKHCRENNQLTCGVAVFLNQERWANDYSSTVCGDKPTGKRQETKSILETYAEIINGYENKDNFY